MSQPYPPPYGRPVVPEQTHLGSWAPQGPPETSHPSLPRQAYPQQPYQQPYQQQPAYPGPYGGYPGGGYPPQGPPPSNAMGVTALVLALVGLVLSWIPFVGVLSVLLGLAAIVFGLVGWNRARQGRATLTLPVVGAAIGIVAIVIGIVSTVLAVRAVEDAGRRPLPSASAPLPAVPPSVAAPAGDDTVPAPGAYDWEDGLSVEVGAPRAVTFSDAACCPTDGGPGTGVAFDVRLVNDTAEVVEPFALISTLTADGRNAEQVFDYTNGFDGVTSSIPPGRDLTVTMAFDAPGGDLLLEFSSFDRDSAFFTATL